MSEEELIELLRRRSAAWLRGDRPAAAPSPSGPDEPVAEGEGKPEPEAAPPAPPAQAAEAPGPGRRRRPRRESTPPAEPPPADTSAPPEPLPAASSAAGAENEAPPSATAPFTPAPEATEPPGSPSPPPAGAPGRKPRPPRREPTPAAVRALRQSAWRWLRSRPAPAVAPLPASPPANDAAPLPDAPPAEGPSPQAPREPPGLAGAASGPGPQAPPEPPGLAGATSGPSPQAPSRPQAPPEPKRRARPKREVPTPEALYMRRRAWAWFAPRATGEAAAGSHVPARAVAPAEATGGAVRSHLKGVLEALIFASEHPLPLKELARLSNADAKILKPLLTELTAEYLTRGFRLDEVAGGYVFRTSPLFAPFVREQVAKKPVKMSRAQIETLAIVAYRQPITRPEIDEVRGVDSGAVLKSLLERELVRILGKKDEPGRPMLYGTTASFLEFFGLRALGDLPTLREFTELTDESRRTYEREMGEDAPEGSGPEPAAPGGGEGLMGAEGAFRRGSAKAGPAVIEEVSDEEAAAEGARAAAEAAAAEAAAEAEAAAKEAPAEAPEPAPPPDDESDDAETGDAAETGDEPSSEDESEDGDEDDDDDDEDDDEDEDDDDDDWDDEDDDDEDDDDEDDDDEDDDDDE